MLLDHLLHVIPDVVAGLLFAYVIGFSLLKLALPGENLVVQQTWAPLVGYAIWVAVTFALWHVVAVSSLSAYAVLLLGLVVALGSLGRDWRTIVPVKETWGAFVIFAAVALVPVLVLAPHVIDGGLYIGNPTFDHARVALIDNIYNTGILPPQTPYYAVDDAGAPLQYFGYYGWYIVSVNLRALLGSSGLAADAATTFLTAFMCLAFLGGLANRLGCHRLTTAFIAFFALVAGLAEPLTRLIGSDRFNMLRPKIHLSEPWIEHVTWVPQHVMGASLTLLVIVVLTLVHRERRLNVFAAVLVGLAAAAGLETSIYTGGVVLAACAVPVGVLLVRSSTRGGSLFGFALTLAVAGVVALAFASPYLIETLQTSKLLGRPSLGLGIYPGIGVDPDAPLTQILGYWLFFLPVGIGITYVVGFAGLAQHYRRQPETRLLTGVLLATTITCFLVAEFVASVVENNDLGWRAFIPSVLILLLFSADFVARALTGFGERPSRGARLALAATVLTFCLSGASLLRTWNWGFDVYVNPDLGALELHQRFAKQPEAWAAVREHTAPTDLVLSNPSAFDAITSLPFNIGWALYADRPSPMGHPYWARVYLSYVDPAIINARADRVDRLFQGTADEEDVRVLAETLRVKAILVTPLDPLWADVSSIRPWYDEAVSTDDYSVFVLKAGA